MDPHSAGKTQLLNEFEKCNSNPKTNCDCNHIIEKINKFDLKMVSLR